MKALVIVLDTGHCGGLNSRLSVRSGTKRLTNRCHARPYVVWFGPKHLRRGAIKAVWMIGRLSSYALVDCVFRAGTGSRWGDTGSKPSEPR